MQSDATSVFSLDALCKQSCREQHVLLHLSAVAAETVICCSAALQVILHKSTATEGEALQKELEATLGLQLEHPNVVRTYKYTTRRMNAVRSPLSSAPRRVRVRYLALCFALEAEAEVCPPQLL